MHGDVGHIGWMLPARLFFQELRIQSSSIHYKDNDYKDKAFSQKVRLLDCSFSEHSTRPVVMTVIIRV